MKTNKEIAKEIIVSYFETLASKDLLNAGGFQEVMAIKFDDTDKILLEHIKAIKNIMEKAIKEIEGDTNVKN